MWRLLVWRIVLPLGYHEAMSSGKGQMIVPPFAGVSLVEYRDRVELTPAYWVREFVGLGKCKGKDVLCQPEDDSYTIFDEFLQDKDVWVVVGWEQCEDGREEPTLMNVVHGTEAEAQKAYQGMIDFCNMSKAELEEIGKCFKQTEEDLAYIRNRFPESPPDPKITGATEKERREQIEKRDLYQARLKVLAGMAPKTVTLMQQAYEAEEPQKREKLEREAVQAYFAELSLDWREDEVLAWQRSNPVGTKWMCEFARVLSEPQRELDPINHELALNWIRRGYNLMTAEELSDAILIMAGERVSPETLKKRRERLGLTSKRPPGPRPKSEQ